MNRQIKADNNVPLGEAVWITVLLSKGVALALDERPTINAVRLCTATGAVLGRKVVVLYWKRHSLVGKRHPYMYREKSVCQQLFGGL